MKKTISFLSSTKFTLIVTIPIIVLVIIGSMIPQGDKQSFIDTYTRILNSADSADTLYHMLERLGLLNVYASPLFVFLLFLFAINLVLCTYKLIPFAKAGYKFNDKSLTNSTTSKLTKDDCLNSFTDKGFKVTSIDNNTYVATKHNMGRWGVITLHVGILLLLLGGFISHAIGYKAVMNILEGDFDNVAVLTDGSHEELGFDLYLDEFNVLYYDNSTRAKSYISEVRIVKNGKGIAERVIDVNHPLVFEGISFYQTSFGVYPNSNAQVRATIITGDGKNIGIMEHFNTPFNITDGYTGKFIDFVSSFALDADNNVYSSSDNLDNPAALFEISKDGKIVDTLWIFAKNMNMAQIKDANMGIKFDKLYGVTYSTLSVKKDPGTPLIYFGFLIVSIGLFLVYLLNYTAIFMRFKNTDNGDLAISHYTRTQRKVSFINTSVTIFDGEEK